jgi:hypothetical protein
MTRAFSLVVGVCFGAGFMYAADPEQGARRRAMGRDRTRHIVREADRTLM